MTSGSLGLAATYPSGQIRQPSANRQPASAFLGPCGRIAPVHSATPRHSALQTAVVDVLPCPLARCCHRLSRLSCVVASYYNIVYGIVRFCSVLYNTIHTLIQICFSHVFIPSHLVVVSLSINIDVCVCSIHLVKSSPLAYKLYLYIYMKHS